MGIKNLNKLLKDKCPELFQQIHISDFNYKKVAIDISLYMFKFKAVCGDRWLTTFINLIASLRRNEVHCVFIYDGKAPVEKDSEKAKRREERTKLEENLFVLEEALDEYHKTGTIAKCLKDLYSKRKSPKRLLKPEDKSIDMNWVEDKIKQKQGQIIYLAPEDFTNTKKLFDILKVPYYTAPDEAEKFCAQLCINGLVDAVLSDDTDLIAYNTPTILSKMDTQTDNCTLITSDNLLNHLNFTKEQLVDLCIMCGTDYNTNINKVGPHTAYKLLTEHQNIENIGSNTNHDISILNHERGRQLFTEFKDCDIKYIDYCGIPDFDELESFITQFNIAINMEQLKKNFGQEIILLED